MTYGGRRLWCDETINDVLGIDDRHVAFRGHSSTFVFDHRDGSLVTGIDPHSITSGDPALCRVDLGSRNQFKVSADGRWVAAAGYCSRIRVFDNTTGEMKFADDPEYGFDALAFSHDGTHVAALADGAYIYTSDAPLRRIREMRYGLAFDTSNDLVGGVVGRVARWNLDGTERSRVSVRHKIESLSVSRDGRFASVTTMCTGGLCMWPMPDIVVADLQRGTAILRFRDVANVDRVAALSPDARWLALSDDRVRLMSAAPRSAWSVPPVLATWEDKHLGMSSGDRALLFSPDHTAEIIELPSGTRICGPVKFHDSMMWSPNGRFLVEVAPDRRRIRFRDPANLEVTGERGFDVSIDMLAISHDGKQLAFTDGPTIEVVRL